MYHLQKFVLSNLGSGEKVHNKLGQYIPPTLPGTKKYWAKEYSDLAAFCERCGVPVLKPLLWNNKSVFGHVTDHWQRRIEFPVSSHPCAFVGGQG